MPNFRALKISSKDEISCNFMKQMQCNALNMKTTAKQVWLYFICTTTRPGYSGNTSNLLIILNTLKNPYLNPRLNHAAQKKKNTCQIFLPQKIPESKNQTQKSFDHPRYLKSGVPPWGNVQEWGMCDVFPSWCATRGIWEPLAPGQ